MFRTLSRASVIAICDTLFSRLWFGLGLLMSLPVTLEVEVGEEALVTVRALEALDSAVDLEMLVQIGSLCEA